jgi:hypothetical protein
MIPMAAGFFGFRTSVGHAHMRAESVMAVNQMRMLYTALQMYQLDKGEYPDSLEELWSGENRYVRQEPRDNQGRPFIYYRTAGPQEIMLAASGPQRGQRNVVMGDGSAHAMPEHEFQRRIREQKMQPEAATKGVR